MPLAGRPHVPRSHAGQLARRPVEGDRALEQHDHARAQRADVLGLVRREEHGPRQARDQLAEAQPLLRVQAGRGLVEDEQLRRAEQRLRQRDAPAHPARERADALVRDVSEPDRAQHAADLLVALVARHPLLQRGHVVDELEGREVAVEAGLLGHVAEPPAHVGALRGVRGVAAEQPQLAAARREHGRGHAHERRLAGAVGA
jgi:hypothetical protein